MVVWGRLYAVVWSVLARLVVVWGRLDAVVLGRLDAVWSVPA